MPILTSIRFYLFRFLLSSHFYFQSGPFSAKEEYVKLWEDAHYKQKEAALGQPLTPLQRFRLRKRYNFFFFLNIPCNQFLGPKPFQYLSVCFVLFCFFTTFWTQVIIFNRGF